MNNKRKGYEALLEKHWNGCHEHFIKWFYHVGLIASDPFPENTAWSRWEPDFPVPQYARETLRRLKKKEGE